MNLQNIEAIYPLSPYQASLLLGDLRALNPAAYCGQMICSLHGPLDSDQGDDRTEEDARHRQEGGLRIGVRAAAAAHIARLAIASVRGVL